MFQSGARLLDSKQWQVNIDTLENEQVTIPLVDISLQCSFAQETFVERQYDYRAFLNE